MEIEMRSIREIKPYNKNAKKHPKEQVARIDRNIIIRGGNYGTEMDLQ